MKEVLSEVTVPATISHRVSYVCEICGFQTSKKYIAIKHDAEDHSFDAYYESKTFPSKIYYFSSEEKIKRYCDFYNSGYYSCEYDWYQAGWYTREVIGDTHILVHINEEIRSMDSDIRRLEKVRDELIRVSHMQPNGVAT